MGAGAATAVAGCLGGSANDGVYSTTTTVNNPERIDYNAYHLNHQLGEGIWMFMTHWVGCRSSGHTEVVPDMVEFEMEEPDLAHVTIRDFDFTWYNGDPVTADDVRAKFVLEKLDNQRPHEIAESYEVIDDDTVAIQMEGPINEHSFYDSLSYTPFNTKYDIYEEWVEEAVETDYDEAVLEDLQQADIGEPQGNGPWEVVDTTGDAFYYELREDHPWSDRFNFDEVEYVFTPEQDTAWQRVITDNTSAEMGRVPESIVEQVPDHFEWYSAPTRFGMTIMFHYDVFPEPRARKAAVHALDGNLIAQNSGLPEGDAYIMIEHQSGWFGDDDAHEEYIGDLRNDFQTYMDQDLERSIELFEEVGYSYEDETLYYPDGDEVSFEFIAPTFLPTFIPRAETAVDQLAEVGIEASVSVLESGGYFTSMAEGDFGAATYYTGGNTWEPAQQLTWLWWPGRIDRPVNNGIDMEAHPVPMPIGDPDGDIEEVDIAEYVLALESHVEEERDEAYRMLSWAHNQTLPHFMITDGVDTLFLDGQRWNGPDDDDPYSGWMSPEGWARMPAIEAND